MGRYRFVCPLAVMAAVTAGCAGTRSDRAMPERRPPEKNLPVFHAPPDSAAPQASPSVTTESEGELGLRNVLELALLHNPRLASASWSLRMGEARAMQAGLLPNPELEVEVEVEDAVGSGGRRGFNVAAATVRLSQLVELGGKRSSRRRVAESEVRLAGWDHEAERLAVLTEATLGFVDVLAAQERLALTQELMRLSEQTLNVAAERVSAGKASPLEKTKAAVEQANSRIELARAGSELRSARKRLASTWGSTSPRFSKAIGDMAHVGDLPPYEEVRDLVLQNPEVARWAQEMEQRLAVLALERARRVPDLTVGVGVQRFEETNDHALTFGLSLPLPIFDRNQGVSIEARHRLTRLSHERRSAEVRAAVALAESYEALSAARAEALGLKEEVVRGASQAFEAAREGYQQGKFGYLEVLDAQRTLFGARAGLLDALARYHRGVAVVESLIGTGLESLRGEKGREQVP